MVGESPSSFVGRSCICKSLMVNVNQLIKINSVFFFSTDFRNSTRVNSDGFVLVNLALLVLFLNFYLECFHTTAGLDL